ncbi:MAG: preprotein translocase subunit SecE [Fimbriimonadaceae bacterium]|jgi:preprotein translocase SecE subunit
MSQTPKTGSVPVPKMRRGVKGFYRDVVREMKHVTWPKPHETTRLTGVVLVVCALIIVLLQFAAFVFGEIVTAIVKGGL